MKWLIPGLLTAIFWVSSVNAEPTGSNGVNLLGTSILGKWECSPDPKTGWFIEYKENGEYEVSFKSGKTSLRGKYTRKDFIISYSPNTPGEASPIYLKREIQAVNRLQRSMVVSDMPGTSAPTMCYLVS